MRVKIREITSDGLAITDQAMPGDLDLNEDFINLEKPIRVTGHLERVDGFVLAHLKATYTIDTVCARCLDPIESETTLEFEADLPFKHGDEFVNIGESVREEILVEYVPGLLCKEDCRGICKGCGAYLNSEPCECENKKKEE